MRFDFFAIDLLLAAAIYECLPAAERLKVNSDCVYHSDDGRALLRAIRQAYCNLDKQACSEVLLHSYDCTQIVHEPNANNNVTSTTRIC